MLIVIVGPTAVGKTALAVGLAQQLGCEVISADARQCYREMQIGTARPTAEELGGVPHHFLGHLSVTEPFDAGQYEQAALAKLSRLFQHDSKAILVGGSGLYVQAVCQGLDTFPDIPPHFRQQLNEAFAQDGLEALLGELAAADPAYFEQVDRANPQRVIRALEVIRATGQPYSGFRRAKPKDRPFRICKIGLDLPRAQLYARIDERMDRMIGQGLLKEAASLFHWRHLNALSTVGYQEIFGFLEGQYDWAEAERLLKRNSRRYAKRQLTWFRRDADIRWVEASPPEQALQQVLAIVQETEG